MNLGLVGETNICSKNSWNKKQGRGIRGEALVWADWCMGDVGDFCMLPRVW